ncbi:glycoside hydrolase family 3 N-terminal domain-containing protein [Sinomicrobium weinanense]|uniref:beta-N-acetylhexosaminidase n=1 Tax=Sinomicrobium weinanense TaxID=2842200 RepID=A0A926Q395_9FLAO|nr:glycoside hydrolase family 3 N-terminal domain-containing protein [Sinomicrobium weinanense]MBC9795520.1 serine hydrolase [Sinomicrobium weinanense]MBU3123333.1 serine hydrolase [Sinomicrobium weinanense]
MKKILALLLAVPVWGMAQQTDPLLSGNEYLQQKWVDSIYGQMSLKEKIGQLFMIDVFPEQGEQKIKRAEELIREYHVGGVIFFKGNPHQQAVLTNKYQAMSKVPLLVGMDAEWGLAMRLDSTFAYPWNMTLGAVKNNKLIEQVGYQIGRHARRLGVHINFAPDIDINTNPENPIIGNRSFGEDKHNVAEKGAAFARGMRNARVLASGKHFPGHGDTQTDSHKTLPTISFSRSRLNHVELYPYNRLISENLESVMVGHLNVPALESRDGYPSSISRSIITGLLKEELGFKGLIFTDALNMKGASNFTAPGDIDLAAFQAGNDMLVMSIDVPKASQKLTEAYEKGQIAEERLEYSVKKILKAKFKVGLAKYTPIKTENLYRDLNTQRDSLLEEEIYANAITVARNQDSLVPLTRLEEKKIAYVHFGDDKGDEFLKALNHYARVDEVKGNKLDELLKGLASYNTVIIGHHRSNGSAWKPHDFTVKELTWLYEIAKEKKVVLTTFVKPYNLLKLSTLENIESIVVGYQNTQVAQRKAAEVIFGAIGARGALPVTANKELPVNTGIETKPLGRLQYGIPESVGMNSGTLKKIDSIAKEAIKTLVMPGAQILVARKGKVIYNKSFGRHTYTGNREVNNDDIYDVASLTKILATLPMIMKMNDEEKITMNSGLGDILPGLKGTNKEKISIKDVLLHYGRIKPWIPFYRHTVDKDTRKPLEKYYRKSPQGNFTVKVAEHLYMREDYRDSIFGEIKKSDLLSRKGYRYSDLGYYMLQKFIESSYGSSLDSLDEKYFYASLGADRTMFNPLDRGVSKEKIVPSEADDYFRHQVIHGYVHDMGAAMKGGVSGHAGLFSNAGDIAKIMQMYMQKGYYGGKRYFKEGTLDKFNTCYYCDRKVRRGLGFDKPRPESLGKEMYEKVPSSCFCHSGFTGTYAWADPENEIVYVFLSNRTYPTASNRKLITKGTRTEVLRVIYDAIEDKK